MDSHARIERFQEIARSCGFCHISECVVVELFEAREASSINGQESTPLQQLWTDVLFALEAALDLPPDQFEVFLSMLTIRVADENIRAEKRWL